MKGYRHFLFAGLEEAQALRPLAGLAGMTLDVVPPQRFEELMPSLLAKATGLEQEALRAWEGFGQVMAGLEELAALGV